MRDDSLGQLLDAAGEIHGGDRIESVLDSLALHACSLLGAERAAASFIPAGEWSQSLHRTAPPADADTKLGSAEMAEQIRIAAELCRDRGSVRLSGSDLASHPLWPDRASPPRNWMAAAVKVGNGRNLGLVQLSDKKDGNFTAKDERLLVHLAHTAAQAIEAILLREHRRTSEPLLEMAGRLAHFGAWSVDLETQRVFWSEEVCEIHEKPAGHSPCVEEGIDYYVPEYRDRIRAAYTACAERGEPYDLELEILTAGGNRRWVRTIGQPERDASGRIVRVRGAFQDIDRPVRMRERAKELARDLELTVESISDAFFTLDRDWRFTYVNSRAEQMFARAREALLEHRLWDAIPEIRGTDFEKRYREAMRSGESVRFDAQGRIRPGTRMRVNVVPFERGLAVFVRDITAEATARRELERNEERFRLAAKAISDAVWDYNIIDDAMWWSEGLQTLFGHEPPQPAAPLSFWLDRIHPEDRERVERSAQEAAADPAREYWKDEYRFLRADGSVAHVTDRGYISRDDNGRAVRAVGGMTDRTDRRLQEHRIAEQAALLDQARDAILVRDLDHRIRYWNKGAERIYGWTAEEATGRCAAELLYDDPAAFYEAMESVLEAGEWLGRLHHVRRDGRDVTIEAHWSLLRDANGDSESVLAINTDITERVAMEAQLRHSQKLEAVGQITGGVAHDFNNLLTVILGNAEMLADSLKSDPQLARLSEMTVTAATKGADLTQRLLAFARKQPLEPRTVDINALVADAEGLLRRTLGENIEIELVRGGGLWRAHIDPGQLESAIINLGINARDAMPGGGRLTIETANMHLDEAYAHRHAELEPGQYVMIAMTDTGSGIPGELIERVVEPFFTTKETGAGTGLGLSMVYGFVKQSGGHFKIYSEAGEGTSVRIYLPRAETEADEPAETREEGDGAGRGETVLVVEDDELVRAHTAAQLDALGYRVREAGNGPEALKILESDDDLDLLFTDVIMPGGMSGRQLADKAAAIRPNLPVLYTSGYTENAIVHHGRLDRGVHLLNKPYRRSVLARKVRQVLREARSRAGRRGAS